MAEETNKDGTTGFPDVEKNNEQVKRQLESQDISGQSNTPAPDVTKQTGDVLDSLLKDAEKKATPTPEDEAAKKAAEEKAAADKEAAEKLSTEDKAAADKKAADDAAASKKVDELFKGSPSLPPNASPKSTEAFAAIKIKAAQEITSLGQKIDDLTKKVAEYEQKLKNPVPQEIEKELTDLRNWRAKLDIDADPKFKQFDKAVSESQEFIYAQLRKSPVISDEVIAEIKKHGGPEKVKLDKIFDAIKDPTIQKMVESKVADIEMSLFQKEQAIKAAKENVSQYVSQRQKEYEQSATRHLSDTEARLGEILPKLSFLQEKVVDGKADEATRKSAEEYNQFVKETNGYIAAAIKDDSAEMRAVQIAGLAKLLYLQREAPIKDARITALEKELKDANEKVERFKNASVSRLRESAVPPNGKTPEAKPTEKDIFNTHAADALDNLAKKVTEERERARSGA